MSEFDKLVDETKEEIRLCELYFRCKGCYIHKKDF